MMLALTVRQPWADAIVRGDKTVENRTWTTAVRGRIAIHAGRKLDLERRGNPIALERAYAGRPPLDFDLGVIIGTAHLANIHPQGTERYPCGCEGNQWAEWTHRDLGEKLAFHWVLTDAVEFVTPIRARGALGLWIPGPSATDLIARAERGEP